MNDGSRISYFLSQEEVLQIGEAIEYAWRIGKPLNLAITINLDVAHVAIRPQHFITGFLKLAGDWLRLRRAGQHYVWVLENRGGLNVHMMIHVPPDLRVEFRYRQRGWLRAARGVNRRGAIHSEILRLPGEPIDDAKGAPRALAFTGLYILKGADTGVCEKYGIDYPGRGKQGKIIGKRCGTSNSLSEKARSQSTLPRIPPYIVHPLMGPRRTPHFVFRWRPMSHAEERAFVEAKRQSIPWDIRYPEMRSERSSSGA